MFADAEGKRGGQFYTPESIVKLLVEMLEPYGEPTEQFAQSNQLQERIREI